ncbi:hypothetical protein [Oceanobacillus sp. J11TS1]|uniref:hypothetical protein n=1 Tax=Oceanobacillus sp. J11TS1 TaxID=2807191 RepID=UPI001B2E7249|nr:hypothetical protein [Oceanobacillus sp. J11TS1]GIO22510.1 hypothetical protein J11TS1_10910 [Oceanobacillus sp. J11TS1]
MITEKKQEDLLIRELNRKLLLGEIEEKVLSITYNLLSDKLYAIDDAIPELIEAIILLNQEQQVIIQEIGRLRGFNLS